ncbi:MAG: alanine racemase, partial [Bacteroidetes bacterium]
MKNNPFSKIKSPTIVVDKNRVLKNIQQFQKKFSSSNTLFRPHFKTHQSTTIGKWFQELGIHQISVSSLAMAWQFYQAGWKDISIVFPFNRLEIELIQKMSKDATLGILIEDIESVDFLSNHISNSIDIYIKVDCGYHRTGIDVENHKLILEIPKKIEHYDKLNFKGILSHFGNTYAARNKTEVEQIYTSSLEKMLELKKQLIPLFPDVMISIGDTPSASIIKDFTNMDEMRPGNFVFYDWMQTEIGSCTAEQIAAIMLCPVVAKH